MIEFKYENKLKIRGLVDQITTISIGNQNPNGFCFATCFALTILLDCHGIENYIVGGNINGTDHFWLELVGYENIIVDATFKQFDFDNCLTDFVHVGDKKENHITDQYEIDSISFNQWMNIYDIWSNPNIDKHGNLRDKELVKKNILHNLISASILNYEIENLDSYEKSRVVKSYLYQLYFRSIINMLKLNSTTDNDNIVLIKSKVGNKFDFLLSKFVKKKV